MKHGTPPQANHGPKNPGRSNPSRTAVLMRASGPGGVSLVV
jgi:hypothetical protein